MSETPTEGSAQVEERMTVLAARRILNDVLKTVPGELNQDSPFPEGLDESQIHAALFCVARATLSTLSTIENTSDSTIISREKLSNERRSLGLLALTMSNQSQMTSLELSVFTIPTSDKLDQPDELRQEVGFALTQQPNETFLAYAEFPVGSRRVYSVGIDQTRQGKPDWINDHKATWQVYRWAAKNILDWEQKGTTDFEDILPRR